jgi:hypothetical protein
VTSIVGSIGFLLGWLRRANFASGWLYFLGAVSIYGVGWACVQAAKWLGTKAPTSRIQVSLRELHRNPRTDARRQTGFHIFLRARLELEKPAKETIVNYRLELSHFGQIDTPEFLDDIADHKLWLLDADQYGVQIASLPRELKAGEPVEGWLHYVTTTTKERTLDESNVRLIVQGKGGSANDELKPEREMWNPRRLVFMPEKRA